VANHSSPPPAAAPSRDQSKTYRVNTGEVAFVPFIANSIEERSSTFSRIGIRIMLDRGGCEL
jgi:hypothetical protein